VERVFGPGGYGMQAVHQEGAEAEQLWSSDAVCA